MTKLLLDSGDPREYTEIAALAKKNGHELWGGTTNPTLIAKTLSGKKLTKQEAFDLQKQIVLKLIKIVPGAVSAEVYADIHTTAEEMIVQGKEIATWHKRVAVKIPTTLEGFRARSELRKANILTNNTLVFSQEQIFAICLHEKIMQHLYKLEDNLCAPLISPFVGRLDDIGINGMDLVTFGMDLKEQIGTPIWMLEASVRSTNHIQHGIDLSVESITAPAKIYREWLPLKDQIEITGEETLASIPAWQAPLKLVAIETEEAFFTALTDGSLSIQHDLTDKGISRFAQDWETILK